MWQERVFFLCLNVTENSVSKTQPKNYNDMKYFVHILTNETVNRGGSIMVQVLDSGKSFGLFAVVHLLSTVILMHLTSFLDGLCR